MNMILIVDDDPSVLFSLRALFQREGYEVAAVRNSEGALPFVRRQEPALIMTDMNFSRQTSGEEGLHFLSQIRVFMPDVPVILMTAWGSIDLAVEGMRRGAFDFITKPWDSRLLLQRVATALSLSLAGKGNGGNRALPFDRAGIIGKNPKMNALLESVARVAPTDAPVLILGENGTGKELIAEALHRNSPRSSAPFVKVNLGGMPPSLFESEMFGHVKGAFTGAVAPRKGRFEMADGGTIFLDEIGELDLPSQVKLLRVLQEQTFEPLGDSRPRKVDVRVVCATNADLEKMVAEGAFREDLFYRINLIELHIPPLRERRDDIPALVSHFSSLAAKEAGIAPKEFSPEAVRQLENLRFPGNIRQLGNIVRRAVILSGGERVEISDLALTPADMRMQPDDQKDSWTTREEVAAMTLDDLEHRAISEALARHDGNLSRAAASLGITRQSLYRRMQKFGLQS